MEDGGDAFSVFTDVALRLDGIEVGCQQLPDPMQMPRHFLNVSCESVAKVHGLSPQERPGRAIFIKRTLELKIL